jgi:CubicO group peptidase (beta-lactamase class C family)
MSAGESFSKMDMNTFPYDPLVSPDSVGMDEGRLARAIDLFNKQQASGAFPGGQLTLRRNGKSVVNESLGIARGLRDQEAYPSMPVQPKTPFPALSAGKPLAAICIALLEDHGLLDVKTPIACIFPEFGKHGKDQITTLDILTHRSGMLMPGFVKTPHLWGDREAVQTALIETIPSYPRGTLAYHPYEYGWMLNEIVLRVDGRSLPDLFVDELAVPLQLPALRFGLAGRNPETVAFTYWLGKEKVNVAGINVAENFEVQNSAPFLDARNPATSLVCDAASLSAFYEFLVNGGTTPAGQQLVSENTLKKYTTVQVSAWDRSLRTPLSIGRGFVVGSLLPSSFGWWNTGQCFGHAGGFSSLAFGDYRTGISVAIVTNGNRNMNDFLKRFVPLAYGLRNACKR